MTTSFPGVTVSAAAVGAYHTLLLNFDGTVLACGHNNFGQLGNGTTVDTPTPAAVAMPAGVSVTDVAANGYHSLALSSTGAVYAWGYNTFGQLGDGTKINRPTPVAVALPGGVTVTAIAAGWSYSLALTSSGSVLAWGWNAEGELGDGTGTQQLTPVAVALPGGASVAAIAAGWNHNLALLSDGSVVAWGLNNFGQLGNGARGVNSLTPTLVSLPGGVTATAIAAGGGHSLAVGSDTTVLAWGWNNHGQLGDGSIANSSTPVTASFSPGVIVTGVSAGPHSSGATDVSDTVYTWGANASGQLGDGTTIDHDTPTTGSWNSPPPRSQSLVTFFSTVVLLFSVGYAVLYWASACHLNYTKCNPQVLVGTGNAATCTFDGTVVTDCTVKITAPVPKPQLIILSLTCKEFGLGFYTYTIGAAAAVTSFILC